MNERNEWKVRCRAIGAAVCGKVLWLVIAACLLFPGSGCHTAASMGLPISAGSHELLPHAAALRKSNGHGKGVPTELHKTALPAHRVEAGDVLVIEPNDFNSPVRLQSDQTVQQDGTIELGEYGRLLVAGHTTQEIQENVQQLVLAKETQKRTSKMALAAFRGEDSAEAGNQENYGVSVRLVNKESGLFYVMGEVNAPGSYPLVGNETVLDALIAAGGLSDRANDHKIILTRPQLGDQKRLILPVCYQQVLQLGDVSTNYQLHPGDRIYVPSLSLWEDVKQSASWGSNQSCPQCQKH